MSYCIKNCHEKERTTYEFIALFIVKFQWENISLGVGRRTKEYSREFFCKILSEKNFYFKDFVNNIFS